MAKTCFVVGPIGGEGTDIRARADALLKHIIKKVLEAPPFEMAVERADEMQKPGLITQQVIERVVNADLVVADLTGYNANALYELALRHVTRKPVVHMLLAGQELPFDIAHQRTIYYDTKDIGAAEQAKEDLKKHVGAVLKNPEAADNPISAALLVLDLRKSAASTDQTLARILTAITELREDVRVVQRAVAPPDMSISTKGLLDVLRHADVGEEPESMGKSRKHVINLGFRADRELLKQIGEVLSAGVSAPPSSPPPTCAICGQPIALGPVGRRSADNAPIHWEGHCPPRPGGGLLNVSV